MRDMNSGKSRGFGYITMADSLTVERILQMQPHYIDGKLVDCKIAIPKLHIGKNSNEVMNINPHTKTTNIDTTKNSKKIFVGGLPFNLNECKIK